MEPCYPTTIYQGNQQQKEQSAYFTPLQLGSEYKHIFMRKSSRAAVEKERELGLNVV